ncbi:MAG: FecR family protein [Tannerella sp.]|jgi:ferric-dicitrate binding protein FerR (iron transport regulator)|nr:FecR family protein [Tannerella sp.]
MNDYWTNLSERFLRNECNAQEIRLVHQALRDGWIDGILLDAIESVMTSDNMSHYIDSQGAVPNEILSDMRKIISDTSIIDGVNYSENRKRRFYLPVWLRIAAAVVIAVAATWMIMSRKPAPEAPVMQAVSVPAGQTAKLTLTDGTVIWLNSLTSLKFPGVFTDNSRDVWLEGEGFFDVKTDRDKPFIVHAGKYDVTATGTKFNIEAYRGDNVFSTSLLEGEVNITTNNKNETVNLQPNMTVKSDGDKLTSDTISNYDHFRWREGLICLKDVHFPELMKYFENCYGIKIVIENNRVISYKCSGKFRRNDGVEYALRVLQRDVRFKYYRDEEEHIIYIR